MASRTILITGANSGVGYAATQVLAEAREAFHIIMTGRTLSKVETALNAIKASKDVKGSLSAIQLDVLDPASIKQAAMKVEKVHGQLDVLINNAGVGSRDSDLKTRMQACLNTNVMGPALVAEAFRPLLLKTTRPYSIYVSSGAGSISRVPQMVPVFGLENGEAYSVSKAALNMLAVYESTLYSPNGLMVFAVCPGFVVSNLRGTDDAARNGWGMGGGAGDPAVAGRTLLNIIRGERDADVGKLVQKGGVYPW